MNDRREGARWSRPQAIKNAVLYAAASTTLAVARLLPHASLRALGRLVGAAAHLLPGPRRLALQNVERAFPHLDGEARRALVKKSFRTLGGYLGEVVATLDRPRALSMDEASREVMRAALARGRGVVLASAHLGPWERVATTLVYEGFPLTAVARESYDPRFDRIYHRLRAGIPTIYRGAPGAAARMVRTLRKGGVLGIPMDLRSRVPSTDVPFLGHVAPTPIGPARIAIRTGAAVVVATAMEGDRVTVTPIPRCDHEGLLTRLINDELSARIRSFPSGWVWMHARWLPPPSAGEGNR
jgi:KDO2-lipid IV(A) lauroyltransferase